MLGMSERSFRRYRRRYEDDGWTDCSTDSTRRPAPRAGRPDRARPTWTVPRPSLARELHLDQDRLAARRPGVQGTQARRPPSPAPAQALRRHAHQDGSRHEWLAGQAACDLIGTTPPAPAFLVEEEGTASTFRALKQVSPTRGCPAASTPTVAATTSTPPRQAARSPRINTPRSAAPSISSASHIAAYSPEARGRSERAFGTLQDRLVKELAGGDRDGRSRRPRRHLRPTTTAASPPRPNSKTAFVPLEHPGQIDDPLSRTDRRATTPSERRVLQIPATPARHHYVKAGPGPRARRNPRPLPRAPMPRPLHRQRRAHRNPNPQAA